MHATIVVADPARALRLGRVQPLRSNAMGIELAAFGVAELVVGPADLATTLAQRETDGFPAVFATARLIALMELAASRALHPLLAPGQLSGGVNIEVTHSAATPPGAAVRAEARCLRLDGKLYVFEVAAFDAGGEIGRGTHARAIVAAERLVAGALRRCPTDTAAAPRG